MFDFRPLIKTVIIIGIFISLTVFNGCASVGEFITVNSGLVKHGLKQVVQNDEKKIFGPKEEIRYLTLPEYTW